jgi:hypothetical protein
LSRLGLPWLRRRARNIVLCGRADGTDTHDNCHRTVEPTRRPVHSPQRAWLRCGQRHNYLTTPAPGIGHYSRRTSCRLELQRHQLDDQRQANARQAEVLRLQVDELRESLEERKREAEGRRRAQASKVFVWQDHIKDGPMGAMTATAHAKNRSEQPVYDLLFIWHDDCRPVTKTQRLRPLDAQHDQLESLRKVNEKQIEVLGLQATDLRESLDERKREAEELRSAQAARVFISQINGTRFKSTELNMPELLDSDTPIEFPASEPECFRATLTAGLLLSLVWTARNWPVRPPAHRDSPSANSPVRTHWFLVHSGLGHSNSPYPRVSGQAGAAVDQRCRRRRGGGNVAG